MCYFPSFFDTQMLIYTMLYLIKPFVCTFLWQQCGKGGKGGISSGILERFCEVCTAESSGSVGDEEFNTFVKSAVSSEPSTSEAGKGKGKGQNQTPSPTVTDSASPSVNKSSEPSTSEGMGQNTDIIVKKVVKVDEEGSPTASPVPSNPPTPTPTPFEPPTKSGKGKGKGQNTDETANTAIRDVEAKFSSKGTCPPGHTGFALTPDCRSTNVCRVGVFKFALDCEVGDVFDLALGRCVKWYRGFVCGVDAEGDLPSLAASSTLSSKPTVAASDSPLPVPRSRPIPEHSSSPSSAPSEGKKHGEPCKKSTWVEDIEANRVISALLDLIDFMRNDKN